MHQFLVRVVSSLTEGLMTELTGRKPLMSTALGWGFGELGEVRSRKIKIISHKNNVFT